MSKGNVVEGHRESRAVGEMGDDKSVGDTTVFVHDEEIGNALSITCGDEVFDDCVTSVETIGIGENKSQFLKRFNEYT